MIKVAYISHFSNMKMGGQRSMVHLIENLDRKRFLPVAVCPEPGELSEKLESIGCRTFFIPLYSIKPKNYIKVWKSYQQIKQFIINENIDIIHPDRDADTLLFGLAKKNAKAKMVWHVRVNAPNPKDKWNFSLSDSVIGVSKAAGNRFKLFKDFETKFHTIYNGVDTTLFYPVDDKKVLRNELGLPTDKFILAFVGQVTKGKGVFDLIESIGILKSKVLTNNLLTLFIGSFADIEEEEQFHAMTGKSDLNEIIQYVPQQQNIEKWMQSVDALIIPSHEGVEGMPRVLYEAMACGTVGLGSDTSGVREAIENDCGLLVKEHNPTDIADKIELLMNDNELFQRLRSSGYKRAIELFDIRRHSKQVMNLYDKLMNKQG